MTHGGSLGRRNCLGNVRSRGVDGFSWMDATTSASASLVQVRPLPRIKSANWSTFDPFVLAVAVVMCQVFFTPPCRGRPYETCDKVETPFFALETRWSSHLSFDASW